MKRFLSLALMAALVLGASSIVYANVCAFDPVPAATILFPFVALDFSGNTGTTTLFNITNVSSEATIVHFTLWTDYSKAILDWNVLLTGYDVQRQNIRKILTQGQLPVTLTEGHGTAHTFQGGPNNEIGWFNYADQNPEEGVQDRGPVSTAGIWVNNMPWHGYIDDPGVALADPEPTLPAFTDVHPDGSVRCDPDDPNYPGLYTTPIPAGVLEYFKLQLMASQLDDVTRQHTQNCGTGLALHDDEYDLIGLNVDPWWRTRDASMPTWMYITADVVWTCNRFFPDAEPDYYRQELLMDNVIIGDMQWVDPTNRFSESATAVHIEADYNLDDVATANPRNQRLVNTPISFYSRYADRLGSEIPDYREPLGTAWAFRYIGAGNPAIDTFIRAWKGSTAYQSIYDLHWGDDAEALTVPTHFIASDCWPYTYYSWDDNENVIITDGGGQNPWSGYEEAFFGDPNLFPMETQEVSIDQLATYDEYGWMLFVWPVSNTDTDPINHIDGEYDPLTLIPEPDFYQTWMGVKYAAFDQYSSFHHGALMANWNCFSDQRLPQLGIDYNYIYDPTNGGTLDPDWGTADYPGPGGDSSDGSVDPDGWYVVSPCIDGGPCDGNTWNVD